MKASRVAALCVLAALSSTPAMAQQPATPPGAAPAVPQPLRPKQFPLGVTYEAVTLNGRPFSGARPAMTLDQTFRMRGFSGCNNYSATAYPLRDQGLAVGPFALTRRSCPAPEMQAERSFLEALRAAQRWDTDGSRLTIRGPAGELVLERAL